MTGPEHYREAERLLGGYSELLAETIQPALRRLKSGEALEAMETASGLLAKAQVHATLALAAATAEPSVQTLGADPSGITRAWSAAIS